MTSQARRSRNVTLKDVATLAGVSVATASKALNGRDHVHPATRQRVIEAAENLSFRPNALAQRLPSGQSGTVGLITHDLDGRFSIPILMGAEDAFGAGKTSVLLCDAREDAIRESYHLQALLGRRVDGLIIVGNRTDVRRSLGQDLPVPAVYVYAPSDDPADLSLTPDNVGAGRLATEHLLTIGRRRIGHIAGDPSWVAALDRVVGVQDALDDAGVALVNGEALFGTWTEAWGRAAARTMMELAEPPDALVCGSDQVARGVLDTLRELGVSVPDDVAVVSFDNWKILATGSRPQLTSVDMNLETLGRTAARALFAALDGERQSGTITQPCRLVVRGSTVPDA